MNFIIFGPTFEASDMMFDDIKMDRNVNYDNYPIKSNILYFFLRVHLNRLPFIPFKNLWRKLYKCNAYISDNSCFIYGNPWAEFMYKTGYIQRLKKMHCSSYHIAYLTDINSARRLPLKEMKGCFDKIYLFDKYMARKLKLEYYPLLFSSKSIVYDESIEYDISFVGQSKGRLNILMSIFNFLEKRGIKCKCLITHCDTNTNLESEVIECRKDSITPLESLSYIIRSRCILEIKSDGVSALSDRVTKAIALNKKILTNNIKIKDHKYYNSKFIQVFNKIESIDLGFFNEEVVDYGYKDDYSPIKFLHFIEDELQESKVGSRGWI